MLVAIISDPHANLTALEAVLKDIDGYSCEAVICLGDLVGYGPDPNEVVTLVMQICVTTLVGNHDLAVLGALSIDAFTGPAKTAIEITRRVLSSESHEMLASLSATGTFEDLQLAHASPRNPVSEYVTDPMVAALCFQGAEFDFIAVGHTHVPAIFVLSDVDVDSAPLDGAPLPMGCRAILNPGSVGQPRDHDPRASWATWDSDAKAFTVHRVEYDIASTQRRMSSLGSPSTLIERLEYGY